MHACILHEYPGCQNEMLFLKNVQRLQLEHSNYIVKVVTDATKDVNQIVVSFWNYTRECP